jgi:hypothetical protein
MRNVLLATAALTLAAAVPASAQMADPMMMGGSGQSCVSNGQFVPCPPGTMRRDGMAPNPMAVPGMAVGAAAGVVGGTVGAVGSGMQAGAEAMDPNMERRMTARERREQRRMMRQQQNM